MSKPKTNFNHKPTRGIPVPNSRVWMDQTMHSTINVCEECGTIEGPFPGLIGNHAFAEFMAAEHHARKHPSVKPWTEAQARALGPCEHEDCERPLYQTDARKQGRPKLCHTHYQAWVRRVRQAQTQAQTTAVAA